MFRFYAGASPKDSRGDDTSTSHGRLFSVCPQNGRGALPLVVRKIPSVWGATPLPAPSFSGKVTTRRFLSGAGEVQCYVSSHLHLNPTRGLNLCPALGGDDDPVWENAILSGRADGTQKRGLDGKDNVIETEEFGQAKASFSTRYLTAAYGGIKSELCRAASVLDAVPSGTLGNSDFRVKRVETYWEFSAPDAVELVKKLSPKLRDFHKRSRLREHGADFCTDGNAISVMLFLSAGEALRIYAKTANRVRFEVIHSPKKQNGLLPNGYSAATLEDCIGKLETLRVRASERVNQLLAFLSEWAEETPQERAGASRYASRWFQCLGFSEASVRLLELLRVNGRIVPGRCALDEERNVIRRAKENDLLRYASDARALFPVSQGTVLPLSGHGLTEEGSTPIPLGHNTETQPVPSCSSIPDSIRDGRECQQVPPSPPFFSGAGIEKCPQDLNRALLMPTLQLPIKPDSGLLAWHRLGGWDGRALLVDCRELQQEALDFRVELLGGKLFALFV